MYWIDSEITAISSAFMNGDNQKLLLNSSLDFPTGLAIDFQMNGRIYWCDEKISSIGTMKFDGTDMHFVDHHLLSHPYRIDIFENHIYWLSRNDGTVSKIDKFGRGAVSRLVEHLDLVEDIKVYHKHKYPPRSNRLFHAFIYF
jgi:hypothetical protein